MPITRRRHTADHRASDRAARALARSLHEAGIEILYLGREDDPRRIAISAAAARATSVEVCVAGGGSVGLLRGVLRELGRLDRRDVSIVVHRVQ